MQVSLEDQIKRAQQLLVVCKHAAMATVNEDGSPHNTPFMFIHDDKLEHVFWGSHPGSTHSQNILRSGQIFVVLYESDKRGGLYIQADNGRILESDELKSGLEIYNRLRLNRGDAALPLEYYTGSSPQRLWAADIKHFWVNASKRSEDGLVIQDVRTKITTRDLLAR